MSEVARIEQYFTHAAAGFDSLYDTEHASAAAKWLNRTFRRDIYERFRLSLDHMRGYGLQTVLDVGCGPGRYEIGLAEIGIRRMVGLDVSSGMIDLARELARNWQQAKGAGSHSSFEFVHRDFAAFQSSEMFDAVLAMGFFDYVQDPAPVLARMRGFARHSVIASLPSISWYRTPIRRLRYLHKGCPVYFYRRSEIDRLARQAGFARHEIIKIAGAGQDYFVGFFL
ncbi:MAG TPA: class I SAM-dependent methyltransferase [Candidatus Dormibacteraeota bacterium]|nr:class I SAM-dependent methyltransferase [Candidatus Dormibacteraeota bacterium]